MFQLQNPDCLYTVTLTVFDGNNQVRLTDTMQGFDLATLEQTVSKCWCGYIAPSLRREIKYSSSRLPIVTKSARSLYRSDATKFR